LQDGTEIVMDVLPCGNFKNYLNATKADDIWYNEKSIEYYETQV